ncbi:G2/M phase-specific E3 ubiquitin-protein ligase-like [Hypomesus transpacificus]|uniref:G2/M phase-specific E3 ubiquitin-protein ligase-like n=1 Tax=Hypomesus transpacificus TaxID=137520 RepID=UPI001F084D07|nr:G2/M phase-specific E3 ubiquitin-protein ligase-like [Hypomesus transpacificus]
MFEMAGRMIGHSVLHGGPGFSGFSFVVVKLLTGRDRDTAASALTLQDCPDLDHRKTIALLTKAKMIVAETNSVTDLCLSWDLPVPSPTNHDWLFQELLTQAVLDCVAQPIKQIRKGLKDTGIWPLLSDRPDVHPIIFPREVDEELDAQEEDLHRDSRPGPPATTDLVSGFALS